MSDRGSIGLVQPLDLQRSSRLWVAIWPFIGGIILFLWVIWMLL